MLLFIDTSGFNNIELAIIVGANVYRLNRTLAFNENYKSLDVLQKFLAHHKIELKQLNRIVVCSGPGSFTGIRVGVSLAQALGYALNISVQAVPKNKVPKDLRKLAQLKLPAKLSLHYGSKPNITKTKKKTR